jgi:Flp pilus assembly protein TadD
MVSRSLAWCPSRALLLTGGVNRLAYFWDVRTGRPVGSPLPHPGEINAVAWSPDEQIIAVAGDDGSARLWDVRTRLPLGPPFVQRRGLIGVTFTPDGKSLITTANDGTTRRWPLAMPAEGDLELLTLRTQVRTMQRMTADRHTVAPMMAPEWRQARAELIAREGTDQGALESPADEVGWHENRARDAEEDGDSFGALWHLNYLKEARPNDGTVDAQRGRALLAAGREPEAEQAFDRASRKGGAPAMEAWYHLTALQENAAGNSATSLYYLNRLIQGGSRAWQLLQKRAEVYNRLGRTAEADRDLLRAAEVCDRDLPELLDEATVVLARRGQWKEAAVMARRAMQPSPRRERVRVAALTCLEAGDRAGFVEVASLGLKQSDEAKPEEIDSLLRLTTLSRDGADWKQVLARVDRLRQRIEAEEKKSSPTDRQRWLQVRRSAEETRGAALVRAGRLAEAVALLRQRPGWRELVFLALARHGQGDDKEARAALANARTVRPRHGKAWSWDAVEADLLLTEVDGTLGTRGDRTAPSRDTQALCSLTLP